MKPFNPFKPKCPHCKSENIKPHTPDQPPFNSWYICGDCGKTFALPETIHLPEGDVLTVEAISRVENSVTGLAVQCYSMDDGTYSLAECQYPLSRFKSLQICDEKLILDDETFIMWRQPLRIVRYFEKDGKPEQVEITVTWNE